tara:strand:- start:173 stop:955 length:783 start_codon:yes stop_codon:yes gene_type:complete
MAWETPLDWTGITDNIVTANQLNEQLRDNLNVLSTHTHTGAAGMGSASMSGISMTAIGTLTFADQSANPDAAGELQRNGNALKWYGSSVIDLTTSDASAGTPSLRSIGTSGTTAAAGNHTHTIATPSSTDETGAEVSSLSSTRDTRQKAYTAGQDIDGCSKDVVVSDAKSLVIVVGFVCLISELDLAKIDIEEDGTVIQNGLTNRIEERQSAGSGSVYQCYGFNVVERTDRPAATYTYTLTANDSVNVTASWIYATVCQV